MEDLHALMRELSSHYANLDYAVRERRMDLVALARRAETRIRAAKSDDDARRAIRSFLNAFGDGHLEVEWTPKPPTVEKADHRSLCERLGYAERDMGGVDFTRVEGFTPIADGDSGDFPGGVARLVGGHRIGVLRIHLFMEKAHPRLCEAARAALGLAEDATCDEGCEDRLEVAVANRLTAALERRLRALAHAGAEAVLIDISGNGGGSDWVMPAVRVMTPTPIPLGDLGVVRHAHWVKQLEGRVTSLEADLAANGDLDHGAIARGIAKLRGAIAEVQTPCDQSAIWVDGAAKPSCTQLVRVPPVLAYAKPESLRARKSPEDVFAPSRYAYHEGSNALPLAVLVDAWTASAAEDFAEMLQDQHAAVIVGAETLGAGCGFTSGGIPTVLPRSGARVRISDCARLRADGSNAVGGVMPDVVMPLIPKDSPYQRAKKVALGLDKAWPLLAGKRKGLTMSAHSIAGARAHVPH